MTTSDTPRTDACPHCGESECKPYYRPHGQECRSPLCEMTERAKKAEAEVERLKGLVMEAAELGDKRSDNFKARAEKAEASLIKINEELCLAGLREYGN